ncbi:hypothetical protein MK079_01590 [Candidatus Gracilibacteria bacterium]|nr:hypothetical protein [Candidatus Gracilibacteria bacterium]
MKKILLGIMMFFVSTGSLFAAQDCVYTEGADVNVSLSKCLKNASVVEAKGDLSLEGKDGQNIFGSTLGKWIANLSVFLYVFAIGAIVYGALQMTLSTGDDEKVKKAKDIVIWGMVGFVALISASALIRLVSSIIFGIES